MCAWLVLLAGCRGSSTLVIQVRTNLEPLTEMSGIGVDLADRGVEGEWDRFVPTDGSRDWVEGVRVAELAELPTGWLSFRVGADDLDGARLVDRGVRTELSGGVRVVTVFLTRDCVGVECPAEDPTATACLAGRCVRPECEEDDARACPEPECESAAECPLPWGACAEASCTPSGACVSVPVAGACAPEEVCSIDRGCTFPGALSLESEGAYHTCARRRSGELRCWGWNSGGQLGDGTGLDRATPVAVSGMNDVRWISRGLYTTCARQGSQHGISCWGYNERGQLGDGTLRERWTPVPLPEVYSDVVELVGGWVHTCARMQSGQVFCWGDNQRGQLTDHPDDFSTSPVEISGLSGVVELAAGRHHTCARLEGGQVRCWGLNDRGQLGDGTTRVPEAPVTVAGLEDAVELAAGYWHTCARRGGGDLVCWGLNDRGQLGDGTTTPRSTPVSVTRISDAVEIGGGRHHTCARQRDGQVRCWGWNYFGQLGDGTWDDRYQPVRVTALTDAVQLQVGARHTCVRQRDGTLLCWGNNRYGQLGDGTFRHRNSPVPVTDP